MIGLATRPFRRYLSFNGRSSRREFWYFFVFQAVVNVLWVAGIYYLAHHRAPGHVAGDLTLKDVFGYAWVGYFFLSCPAYYALVARRFHDIGQSGWWAVIHFIPIAGPGMVLVAMAQPGQAHDNVYGPSPSR